MQNQCIDGPRWRLNVTEMSVISLPSCISEVSWFKSHASNLEHPVTRHVPWGAERWTYFQNGPMCFPILQKRVLHHRNCSIILKPYSQAVWDKLEEGEKQIKVSCSAATLKISGSTCNQEADGCTHRLSWTTVPGDVRGAKAASFIMFTRICT